MLLVAASPSQTNFLVIPRLLDMIWCNFCSFNLVIIRMDTNLKNFLLKSLFSTHKMELGIKEKKKKICLALVYPLFLHQTVTNKFEKQLHWTFLTFFHWTYYNFFYIKKRAKKWKTINSMIRKLNMDQLFTTTLSFVL